MMRARHRLSKLLLRHGIVYYGGTAWTGRHDVWLRQQRFEDLTTQLTFESDDEAAPATTADAIAWTHKSRCWLAKLRSHPAAPTAAGACAGSRRSPRSGSAVEIGDRHRFTGSTIGSFARRGPRASTPPAPPAWRGRSRRRPGTAMRAGCSSRLPGNTTAPATSLARPSAIAGTRHHRGCMVSGRGAIAQTAAGRCPLVYDSTLTARTKANNPRRTPPSPAKWLAGAGRWPARGERPHRTIFVGYTVALMAARGINAAKSARPRPAAEITAPRCFRHSGTLLPKRPSCGNQPAHISREMSRVPWNLGWRPD